MTPTVLTAAAPEPVRRRYKVVRADTMEDVWPGSLILSASAPRGHCILRSPSGGSREFDFGPCGIRIVEAA